MGASGTDIPECTVDSVDVETVQGTVGTVIGHKNVFDHNIMGAGGFQAHNIPVVDNLVVTAGNQEGSVVRGITFIPRRYDGTEESPVAVFGTGRKAPLTAQSEATFNVSNFTDGHIRRRDQNTGVVPPDILCRTVIKQGQLPVMNSDNAQYPR